MACSGQAAPPPKAAAADAAVTQDLDPVYGLHPTIVAQLSEEVKEQILTAKQRVEVLLGSLSGQQGSKPEKAGATNQVDVQTSSQNDGQASPEVNSAAKHETAEMPPTADLQQQAAKPGKTAVSGADSASQLAQHLAESSPLPKNGPQEKQQITAEPKPADRPDEVLDSLNCQQSVDLGAAEGSLAAAPRAAEEPDDFLGSLLGTPDQPLLKRNENGDPSAAPCEVPPLAGLENTAKISQPVMEESPKSEATTEIQPAVGPYYRAPNFFSTAAAEASQKLCIAAPPPVGDPGALNFSARKEAAAKFQGALEDAAWEAATKTATALEAAFKTAQQPASVHKPVSQQPEDVSSLTNECSKPAAVSTKPPLQTGTSQRAAHPSCMGPPLLVSCL